MTEFTAETLFFELAKVILLFIDFTYAVYEQGNLIVTSASWRLSSNEQLYTSNSPMF